MISPPSDLSLTQPTILDNILYIFVGEGFRVKTLEHLGLDAVAHGLREAWHAWQENGEARAVLEFIDKSARKARLALLMDGTSLPLE